MNYSFIMGENEYWWGGTSVDGSFAPFDKNTFIEHDFNIDAQNQTMPMFLSSKGRCIWSENPFKVKIHNGVFEIDGKDVSIESFGNTLKDAYKGAQRKYFPVSGNKLPKEFFCVPQYNTWMQMTYHPTQEDVMKYAQKIIDNGFTPGILMIDEGWQIDYGNWEFNKLRFPNPKEMISKLHGMGFKVMLWVTPNMRPDGEFFIRQYFKEFNPEFYDKMFLRTEEGKVALCEWWEGFSAVLDLTKECDCDFLDKQLHHLMDEYGVDGFKFDGGAIDMYAETVCINGVPESAHTAAQRNIAWNKFGEKYKYHEYKDTFKGGGVRMIERIRDRGHCWEGDGLSTLIPNAIMQGILGHPFICPDMIGGGEWTVRALNVPVDEELFVRMAQCSALFPMMQFSWAPWEAVDEKHLKCIKAAEKLHVKFSDIILSLVEDAYDTGEPILRSLEYNYPNVGYEKINDIFMLGENILVAPIIKKGQTTKEIPLPEGEWEGFDGNTYIGGKTISLAVSLEDLPYFTKKTSV